MSNVQYISVFYKLKTNVFTEQLNMTLHFFCGRLIGTLVDITRGSPELGTLKQCSVACGENPDVIPPSNMPLPLDAHRTPGSLGPPRQSISQTASRSVQPFLQRSRWLQTDTQTDRPRYAVCNDRPHLERCDGPPLPPQSRL